MEETINDRRSFLRKAGQVTGSVALLTFGGLTGLNTAASAQGGSSNPDTTQDIINAAFTAEQLATTFYYLGILAAQLDYLPDVADPDHMPYFQAALWQEYSHASLFASLGAKSLAGSTPMFYFPTGTFQNQNTFFNVLDALETAFIGAYTAAIGSWAGDAPLAVSSTGNFTAPQLAKVAAQILGTEAEHRALGRDARNANPPNNLILERAPYTEVGSLTNLTGTAVGALVPFVTGGKGFTGPYALPTTSHVKDMASPYTNLTNPGLPQP